MIAIAPSAGTVETRLERRAPLWPVKLFLVAIPMPFLISLGPLLLTADRVILILFLLPCFFAWVGGRAGRRILPDFAVFGVCFWMAYSTLAIDGAERAVEPSGIFLVETLGPYLIARRYVRDAESFYRVVRFLVKIVFFLFPFAVYETLTSRNLLLELANRVWISGSDVSKDPRWGLDRVSLTFDHPILFGVFCGAILSLAYYVYGYQASRLKKIGATSLVGLMSFLSLSSGPATALAAQLALIMWDNLMAGFEKRWIVLVSGIAALWTALSIAANRSVPELFIAFFAFNGSTAYNRLRIWEYGSQSVMNYPLFGIGLYTDWERPYWMTSSMDMFWLQGAVKHGLPFGLLLHMAFFSMFLAVTLSKGLNQQGKAYRTGFLISLVGIYLAGWTVHYWKSIYIFAMFLLGCGGSFVNDPIQASGIKDMEADIATKRRVYPFRRFSHAKPRLDLQKNEPRRARRNQYARHFDRLEIARGRFRRERFKERQPGPREP